MLENFPGMIYRMMKDRPVREIKNIKRQLLKVDYISKHNGGELAGLGHEKNWFGR